jgi:hypothetical protein
MRLQQLGAAVYGQAGFIGTFKGVGAFYGASLLGATPSIIGSFAALDSVTVVVGSGSPFHVAFGIEGDAAAGVESSFLHANGSQFFNFTIRSAAGFMRSGAEWFRFGLPVLSTDAVMATEGEAASSCVTGACFAIFQGWW